MASHWVAGAVSFSLFCWISCSYLIFISISLSSSSFSFLLVSSCCFLIQEQSTIYRTRVTEVGRDEDKEKEKQFGFLTQFTNLIRFNKKRKTKIERIQKEFNASKQQEQQHQQKLRKFRFPLQCLPLLLWLFFFFYIFISSIIFSTMPYVYFVCLFNDDNLGYLSLKTPLWPNISTRNETQIALYPHVQIFIKVQYFEEAFVFDKNILK